MKIIGRFFGVCIAVLALVGEISRLTRFDGAVWGYLFGWDYQQVISRLAYPLTVMLGLIVAAAGILCAFIYGTRRTKLLKGISGLALGIFLLRPFVWIVFYRIEYGGASYEDIGNEIRAWWVNYPISFGATKVATTFSGIILLLLLIGNLILAMISKQSISVVSNPNQGNHLQPIYQQPVYQQPQFVQPPQPQAQQSMTAELAELERMFESGALTKTEFTAAKKRVLGS